VDASEEKTYDDLVNKTINLKPLRSTTAFAEAAKTSQSKLHSSLEGDSDDEHDNSEAAVLLGSDRRQAKRSIRSTEKRSKR
jgi:hypothetical protein